ncbi:hydrolase [Robiginitalea aurantiaca]|uniref:Hydrolase n=1 Tax=Robiginitalea aurantiaca TaxID=3056915 RepID=A0ABT7WG01_9FLAO|nr:hydrolase [Robiginitalea aurantiaca]MDM9631848.1 hydrolase [Robiginitalea aurantiaca]
MKKNLFQYLFVFAALVALYLAVSGSRRLKSREAEIDALQQTTRDLRDSLQEYQLTIQDLQYFSLENNDDALAYTDPYELEDPMRYIADKLLETNEMPGNNPLVPYEGMEGDFKINKIKLLNHRWIIADFSDGKYWGELLIGYEIREDLGADFTLIDHLLYTRSQ